MGFIDQKTPPSENQFQCWHCGKMFSSNAGKNSHLGHCKKRALIRHLKVQNYLFLIRSNPRKRKLQALEHLTLKYGDAAKKLVIGALYYAQYTHEIIDFAVWEIKTPAFIQHEDGLLTFTTIIKKTTPVERAGIKKEIDALTVRPLPEPLPERKHIARV